MSAELVAAEELLRAGSYREGFAAYESRPGKSRLLPNHPAPEWNGEPLAGKTILVWGEQGLGDEILFARFLPLLKQRGAQAVYLACHPLNMQLFRGMGADRIYNRMAGQWIDPHHYWVALGSLPHQLGVDAPKGAPYLRRPATTLSGKVGLAWRGSPRNPNEANRSLPGPDLLSAIPNGVFLEPAGDMKESAAQVAGLSAVVTVCTSWAHLAGAMGVRTHVLVPAINPYWVWGESGPGSPWYDSVTVHRQVTPGDWSGPISEVIAALSANDDDVDAARAADA
jgi:hypothetical protein